MRFQVGGQITNIGALIAICRKFHFLTGQLLVAQINRLPQGPDLAARIVDVIFLLNIIAAKGKNIGDRIPHGRTAAVSDMQRPGGIRAHKFNLKFLTLSDITRTVSRIGIKDLTQNRMPGGRLDKEINKPRPGDFRFLNQLLRILQVGNDGICNFARRHFLNGGHHHGNIA